MVAHDVYELLKLIELQNAQILDALAEKPPNVLRAVKLNRILNDTIRKALKRNKDTREHIFAAQLMSSAKGGHNGSERDE